MEVLRCRRHVSTGNAAPAALLPWGRIDIAVRKSPLLFIQKFTPRLQLYESAYPAVPASEKREHMPPGHAAVNKAEAQVPAAHETGLLQLHVVDLIVTVTYVENLRCFAFASMIESKPPINADWIRPLCAWGATSLGLRVLDNYVFEFQSAVIVVCG